MQINEVNCKIGGPAGTGVNTIGLLFAKCMQRAGLEVFGTNDYPSLIRGGHNTYSVRASSSPVHSLFGKQDILIALDRQTIEKHTDEISEEGALIFDSDKITDAKEIAKRSDLIYIGAPLSEMAAKSDGEMMLNSVALGVAAGILQVDFSIIESLMQHIWGRKGEKVVLANVKAAKSGYDFSKSFLKKPFKIKIEPIKKERKIFINANEACVAGAIAAGCKFVAEYPMSPSTSILHLMAGHEYDFGIIVKQTEDEIAAANMIAGAAYAGVRAMTATSGGGFSLMAEALSLMGMAETGCIIFESQRRGPSTGLPTYTEQADLSFVLHAGQGEFPRVVVAPGDPTECFVETVNAFNLADILQTPVIVLLDKYLSDSSFSVDDFRKIPVKIERGKLLSDDEVKKDYKRYVITEDGISSRCIPGQKNGMHVASSYEHDETGFSSEDPKNRISQINKRAIKLSSVPKEMIAPSFYGADEKKAEILLVCWGSTKGVIQQALPFLPSARMMHIRYASPFPTEAVLSSLKNAKKVMIFEGNSEAQMRQLIFEKTKFFIEKTYLRYDGRPFTAEEIVECVKNNLGR